MDNEGMDLDIIINPKTTDDGQAVIQLETAAGAAIKHFKHAHGINVPRNRFLPVKSCSDLLLIKSDIYSLKHGQLVINENRLFATTPVIKLGDHFKKVRRCLLYILSVLCAKLTWLLCFADRPIPKTIQAHPYHHRARPSNRHRWCLLWTKHHVEGHCYRCGEWRTTDRYSRWVCAGE